MPFSKFPPDGALDWALPQVPCKVETHEDFTTSQDAEIWLEVLPGQFICNKKAGVFDADGNDISASVGYRYKMTVRHD